MAATILTVDGFDTGTLGLIVQGVEGWQSTPKHTWPVVTVPNVPGQVVTTRPATILPRDIMVRGMMTGATAAALRANVDELKARIGATGTEILVRFPDDTAREFEARMSQISVVGRAPQFIGVNPWYEVLIQVSCFQPFARTTTENTPTFNATPDPMAMGTAPTFPVLQMGPCTNPVIIYKDSGGTEQGRMEFGSLTVAGGDTLDIDMEKKTIIHTISSTPQDDRGELTAGNYFALDPKHGVFATSSWPTLEVQSGTGTATYRRKWL